MRISKGWKAFWKLRNILKSNIKLKTKIRILDSCVVPVLIYGVQTWSTTNKQLKKLTTTYNDMLRNTLQLKKIETRSVQKKLEMTLEHETWDTELKKLKFKYAGHLAREETKKWNRVAIDWITYDQKYRKGRPATRWVDEIIKKVVPRWVNMAQHKKGWKWVAETCALYGRVRRCFTLPY